MQQVESQITRLLTITGQNKHGCKGRAVISQVGSQLSDHEHDIWIIELTNPITRFHHAEEHVSYDNALAEAVTWIHSDHA